MPQRNGTGPQGLGPSTGRKLGNCTPKIIENKMIDQNLAQRPTSTGKGLGHHLGNGSHRGLGKGQRRGRTL